MLVAYRLTGLFALEVLCRGQPAGACKAAWAAWSPRSDGSENQKIGTQ